MRRPPHHAGAASFAVGRAHCPPPPVLAIGMRRAMPALHPTDISTRKKKGEREVRPYVVAGPKARATNPSERHYHAKSANALLASAMRWVSSRFFMALPSLR